MKFIKRFSLVTGFLTLITLSGISFADTSQMNTTLARISTILSQVNPLINLAERQQGQNARVKFQFNALRQDLASIQAGIAQAINRVSIQPRTVKPLSGDYLPEPQFVSSREASNHKENTTS